MIQNNAVYLDIGAGFDTKTQHLHQQGERGMLKNEAL